MLKEKEKAYKPKEKKGFSLLTILFLFYSLISTTIFINNKIFAQEVNNPLVSPQPNLAKELEITGTKKSSIKELDELEEKVLHQKYTAESNESRISRLEEFIFGKQFISLPIESRIGKLLTAIPLSKREDIPTTPNTTPKITEESNKEITTAQKEQENKTQVVYDEAFNTGVLGAVSQIEIKIYKRNFNDIPFEKRVEKLEETILSRGELNQSRKKPLIERVSILVKKAGLPTVQENGTGNQLNQQINLPNYPNNNIQPQNSYNAPQSYTVDPGTGFLINEQTGEITKDGFGNPIKVRVPQQILQRGPQQFPPQFPGQQNQFPNTVPYGNPLQQGGIPGLPGGQFPYDQLFNQGGLDPGGEDGY